MTYAPPILSPTELATQRKSGQWTEYFLAIADYTAVYTAELFALPSTTDMVVQVSYTNGGGILSDVLNGMTMYVGTSPGAYNRGMCRIRKTPTASIFYVTETSEINWTPPSYGTIYLTVVNDFQIRARPLKITNLVTYMDVDVPYLDQHTNFDPVPVLGGHAVGWLTGGPSGNGTATITFDASDSWVFDSSISSGGYHWVCPDATITNHTTATPSLEFDSTGMFVVSCEVTAANGKKFTGYRYVFIFNEDYMPETQFTLGRVGERFGDGGWAFDVTAYAGVAAVRDRAMCVLFCKDYNESGEIEVPCQIPDRANIVCVGWINGESITQSAEYGKVDFSVEGAQYWMKNITNFPSGLKLATNTPGKWIDMPGLNVNRALWHLLHWRSTVTAIMDVRLTSDTKLMTLMNPLADSLWEQAKFIINATILGYVGVDRFCRLFADIEPQLQPTRTWPTVMTVTYNDLQEDVMFERNIVNDTSMVDLSGVKVNSTGSGSSFFSLSYGHVFGTYGKPLVVDKLLLSSQSQANTLAGLLLGWKNNNVNPVTLKFGCTHRATDCFPNQFLAIIVTANFPRGSFSGNLIPREISFVTDESGFSHTEITCEAETFEQISINGDIPASTGVEDFDYSIPPFSIDLDFPDLGTIVYLPPTVDSGMQFQKVVAATNLGVYYTLDFDVADPTYYSMNDGWTTAQWTIISKLVVSPIGTVYAYIKGDGSNTGTDQNSVWACSQLGGTWQKIFAWDDYTAEYRPGYEGNPNQQYGRQILGIGVNPFVDDELCIFGGSIYTGGITDLGGMHSYLTYASGLSVDTPIATVNGATTIYAHGRYANVIYSNGGWTLLYSNIGGIAGATATPAIATLSHAGIVSAILNGDGLVNDTFGDGVGTSDVVLGWPDASLVGYRVFTGISGVQYTQLSPSTIQQMSFSPSGIYGMGSDGSFEIMITVDGGATWFLSSVSCLEDCAPLAADVFENCKDDYRWIIGSGGTIWLTMDQGFTIVEKTGNLLYIAPTIDIQQIRYLG